MLWTQFPNLYSIQFVYHKQYLFHNILYRDHVVDHRSQIDGWINVQVSLIVFSCYFQNLLFIFLL